MSAISFIGGVAGCAHVRRYFEESGFTVVRDEALRCRSWTDIARVPESRLRETLIGLDGPDVDALVQIGTNLSMTRLAANAEAWLGKLVIAINTATDWHALRANKIGGSPRRLRPPAGRLLKRSSL